MAADGIGSGQIPPGADRTAIAHFAGQQALAALGNLTPGSVFSGRVVGSTGGDTWQIAVRGGTVTIASPTPLTPDAVLQFVLVTGGGAGPLQVRLADQPGATGPATSAAADVLRQLGVPVTPTAAAVLEAFTTIGAPLTPTRLRHAVAVIEQAAQEPPPPGGDEPPVEEPRGGPSAGGSPGSS